MKERTSLSQKWWINWTIVLVGCLIQFLPLFIHADRLRKGHPVGAFGFIPASALSSDGTIDTEGVLAIVGTGGFFDQAFNNTYTAIFAPYLGIVLPASLDLLIDIYNLVNSSSDRHKQQMVSKVVRMSLLERTVFIIGCSLNGLYLFFPFSWNIMILHHIKNTFDAMTTILTAAPVLIFLERSTKAFNPLFTTALIVIIQSGGICLQFASMMTADPNNLTFNVLNNYKRAAVTTFGCLICARCVWSFQKYMRKSDAFRTALVFLGFSRYFSSLKSNHIGHDLNEYEEFEATGVPALHMAALFVQCVIDIYWYNCDYNNLTLRDNMVLNILFLISTAFVLVIEMRVRQNEVFSGLAQLESKRSFVRFISHEVRTPLSTAMMGLELLGMGSAQTTSDGTNSSRLDGTFTSRRIDGTLSARRRSAREDKESLELVYESIRVAENIFDSLIDFEAHDDSDQMMVLQYQKVDWMKLLDSVIAPLKLQAIQAQVTLMPLEKCVIVVDGEERIPIVDVDQRRISQAIRSLVSAAITLSPKNGTVTFGLRYVTKDTASTHNKGTDSTAKGHANTSLELRQSTQDLRTRRSSLILEKPEETGRGISNKSKRLVGRILGGSEKKTAVERDRESYAREPSSANSDQMSAGKGPRFVVLEMTHSGVGFDKADAKKMNNETFSFNPNDLRGGGGLGGGTGSGLGLSLAKIIVQAHGGRVWIDSNGPASGATFSLRLPCTHLGPEVLDLTLKEGQSSVKDQTSPVVRVNTPKRGTMASLIFSGTGGSLAGLSMKPSVMGSGKGSGKASLPPLFSGRHGLEEGDEKEDSYVVLSTSRQHRSSLTPLHEALNEHDVSVRGTNDKVPSIPLRPVDPPPDQSTVDGSTLVAVQAVDLLNSTTANSPGQASGSLPAIAGQGLTPAGQAQGPGLGPPRQHRLTPLPRPNSTKGTPKASPKGTPHGSFDASTNPLPRPRSVRSSFDGSVVASSLVGNLGGSSGGGEGAVLTHRATTDEPLINPTNASSFIQVRPLDKLDDVMVCGTNAVSGSPSGSPSVIIAHKSKDNIKTDSPKSPQNNHVEIGNLHVLVVEDSGVARAMLVRLMKSLKCTTGEAEDGVEAVRMVKETMTNSDGSHPSFDLILCDSVMPNMDGPTAVKLIREMGFTNPILGVTGNVLPDQVRDFMDHGVDEVLGKPVKMNVLKEAIARHMSAK